MFFLYLWLIHSAWTYPVQTSIHHATSMHQTHIQNPFIKPVPAYAKWGRLAVAEAARRYPQEKVVDYLYVGHQSMGASAQDTFRLWLRGPQREFGVLVKITYLRTTEQVQSIEVTPIN